MGVRETNSPLEQRVDKIVNSTEFVEQRNPDNGVLYAEIRGTAPESRRSILERIVNELSEQRRNLSLQRNAPEQFLDDPTMRFLGAYLHVNHNDSTSIDTSRGLNSWIGSTEVNANLLNISPSLHFLQRPFVHWMDMHFHQVLSRHLRNQSTNVAFDMEMKPPMMYTGPISVEYHRDEFFYAAMLGTPTVKQRRLKQRRIREQKQNGGIRSFYFFDHYRKRRSAQ